MLLTHRQSRQLIKLINNVFVVQTRAFVFLFMHNTSSANALWNFLSGILFLGDHLVCFIILDHILISLKLLQRINTTSASVWCISITLELGNARGTSLVFYAFKIKKLPTHLHIASYNGLRNLGKTLKFENKVILIICILYISED
ncbi:hypothetical protein S83_039440 [Arachis hypogaea]|nr:uncharacterized protein DS421_12g374620 [Arachis hypogaea]